jgi:zinc D-Ala-D-Ala carboxypeptidase
MGDLTKDFSLDEFLVSSTAAANGISNAPTDEHLRRIRTVTAPGMQLVRNVINRGIVITSAYRNPVINRMVGGVATSDHPEGYAVDSRAAGLSAYSYAMLVASAMKRGGLLYGHVDQLILETSRSIVHISFAPRLRAQIMTQKHGAGTPFQTGIVG